ncbi:hypothetical protein V1520DRAFT_41289 [Lipomyces starkeyi]
MAYHTHRTRRKEEDDVVVLVLTLALLASLKVSRNRCYLTRPVLVSPNNSPWQLWRASGVEKAFNLTTGLNPAISTTFLAAASDMHGTRQPLRATLSPITGNHAHIEGPLTLTLCWDWYCTI